MKRMFLVVTQLVIFLFIALSFPPLPVRAQILYDTPTQELVLEAIDRIYNYEFAAVEPVARQIRAKYPNHPVNAMLKAMQMQWQYLPVKDNKAMSGQYAKLLEECIAKAKVLEKNEKTRPEAAFFSMAGHGYIALIHNYNDEKMKAASEAKKAYDYVMSGFKYMNNNPEFYFSSGLYNYYMIRYPEDHPIVKPVVLFFKDGNREEGLRQMDIASKKGMFTRTESSFYLARIYLKHEQRYDKASSYLGNLVEKYPNNPIFLMKHTEALLLLGKYDEAQPFIEKLKKRNESFFSLVSHTLEGMYLEKQSRNDQAAQRLYLTAIRQPRDEEYTKEYQAFAYAGLARIAIRAGDKRKATEYYKIVSDLAEYKGTLKEAKNFLK
ncbi:ABC transporter substrate-binding protein [Runella sp. SP2]|uniref:ABC transporter substrate-binding protein n=1 Tax=Runella sp. SP2 TaxID=2268026 RepID=UPI001E35A86B|nr:ABC transporter substrate-binding protein [Runella sp. SP2]